MALHALTKTISPALKAMALAVVCVVVCAFLLAKPAFADDLADAQAQAAAAAAQEESAQSVVEETAAAYEQAAAALEQIEAEIAENEARLAELAVLIPQQQAKSDLAFRSLYKMQNESGNVLTLLLSSGSLRELFLNLDYVTAIYGSKTKAIDELKRMKSELDLIANGLADKRALAAEEAAAAQAALEEAQAARESARAAAEAARAAEAEAAAAAVAAAEEEERRRQEAGTVDDPPSPGNPSSGDVSASPGDDGANWDTDKETFVNAWAGRIDAYMGSAPLGGYGATFAAAAWDYGIDPRFSAAISCIESSKGLYCFRNHNAWGWGSVDWDSWEEAIYAHARGLSRGYGYTVTVDGAKKYCPPNWEFWYSRVCAEMSKI